VQPLLQRTSSKNYIYWLCVFVVLGMAHAPYCHLWSPARQYFSTFSHKRQDFIKKLLNVSCVGWFSVQFLFKNVLILRRTERDRYMWVLVYSDRCYSCQILIKLKFLDRFSKNPQIWNFVKILRVGAELFHTHGDRQRDRHSVFAI